MRYFVFDTETTGLNSNVDEVIQLSGFLLDEELRVVDFVNYYCNTNVFINPQATAAHGLTNKMLLDLSKGKTLEDHLETCTFLKDCKDTVFIAYNTDFDIRMVNATLMNNGIKPIDFGRKLEAFPRESLGKNYNICAMKTLAKFFGYRGYQKLELMVKTHLNKYSTVQIEKIFERIMEAYKVDMSQFPQKYHNAAFDAFVTTMLIVEYRSFYSL